MIILSSLVAAGVLLVVYMLPALRRFKQRYDFAQIVPGPPVFGMINAIRTKTELEFMSECRQKYGPVFRLWLGFDVMVIYTDPEDVKTILKSNELINKSSEYSFVEYWLGKGLLTNGGENWHLKRKLLTPGFHFQILSTFREPMEECCNILVERLDSVADGRPVDIYQYITLFALDVICETAMGIKVNAQLNEESEFVKKTQLTCELLAKRIFGSWERISCLYKWSSDKKALDDSLNTLHGETRRVIKLRKSLLDAEQIENAKHTVSSGDAEVSDLGQKRRRAFLDSLLLVQRETGMLSDANIQEEVDTFMFEGHDTTSISIALTISLLAQHPEVQKKLIDEINQSANKDDLQSLPYLEAVIKESLRLYPSVPQIARQSEQPFTVGNYTVPPFVSIAVHPYLIHRDPNQYPEPLSFRPERFLANAAPIHPFANIAFSAGPRNCIGQRFAMLELKCSLSRLVQAFEFAVVPEFRIQLGPEVVLRCRNGVLVKLYKRTPK